MLYSQVILLPLLAAWCVVAAAAADLPQDRDAAGEETMLTAEILFGLSEMFKGKEKRNENLYLTPSHLIKPKDIMEIMQVMVLMESIMVMGNMEVIMANMENIMDMGNTENIMGMGIMKDMKSTLTMRDILRQM